MKVVIIGGGAAGASCAARLRRLDEKAQITIIEKTSEVSIANCGLPYYISGVINEREKILVSDPQKFRSWFNIEVELNTEIAEINRDEKFVLTTDNRKFEYDYLVLATGAAPIVPPFEGLDRSRTFVVRSLDDADRIKGFTKDNNAKNAVIVGGGFIGIEVAENLVELGINTTLVELNNQILAQVDPEIALIAYNHSVEKGINFILSDGVKNFREGKVVLNSGNEIDYDICILSIGVKPETALAVKAGLDINRGIVVDDHLRTSDSSIYAAGDNIEIIDFVTGHTGLIPLAGPANRQGRIVADNIAGLDSVYKQTQGSSAVKVFDLTVSGTGNNEKQLKQKGISYLKSYIYARSHAGYYPDSDMILFKLLFDKEGNILGAAAVGESGVEKRIDVIATIIRNHGTIYDMRDAELCYAPPYSSAKDPVNILGMNAENIIMGLMKPAYMEDLEDAFIVDVRPEIAFKLGSIKGAVNIPITEIRKRMGEIPKDKKVVLTCSTGYTSYCAQRILLQNGFDNVYSFMGGNDFYRELTRKPRSPKGGKAEEKAGPIEDSDAVTIDATGLQCPGPIMKVAKNLASAEEGTVFRVLVTDKGFAADIGAWCKSTGNTLLKLDSEGKKIVALIKKGTAPETKELASSAPAARGQTIVVFSDDLDKAIAAFIIANGARAAGKDVTMFFTFWGLNVLKKGDVSVKKGFVETMFDIMTPKGAGKLTLSKLNMGGIGSSMLRGVMKKKNILTLSELIGQARENGIRFIACTMSMDVMGIVPEELIDGVEFGGVAKYIGETEKSGSNLFI